MDLKEVVQYLVASLLRAAAEAAAVMVRLEVLVGLVGDVVLPGHKVWVLLVKVIMAVLVQQAHKRPGAEEQEVLAD